MPIVLAVSVCGFHHYNVGIKKILRIADDWLVGVAYVAGEYQRGRLVIFEYPEFYRCRSQKMPCVCESAAYAWKELELLIIMVKNKMLESLGGILGSIQRLHRVTSCPESLSCLPFCIVLLNE